MQRQHEEEYLGRERQAATGVKGENGAFITDNTAEAQLDSLALVGC